MDDTQGQIVEFHTTFRPRKLSNIIGQDAAVKSISEMLEANRFPQVSLLIGPSGVGKTTMARIVAQSLGCQGRNFKEINAASSRGIDTIRAIQKTLDHKPWGGTCKIYYLDEVASLTRDAQQSLLKTTEEPPSHVFFILATTDPHKLLATLRSRCTEIKLQTLTQHSVLKILERVSSKLDKPIQQEVLQKLSEIANGSARIALKELERVSGLPDSEQLAAIEEPETMRVSMDVARALVWQRFKWAKVSEILRSLSESTSWEEVRRIVLANACKALLESPGLAARAADVISEFEGLPYPDGKAGLASLAKAAFNCTSRNT